MSAKEEKNICNSFPDVNPRIDMPVVENRLPNGDVNVIWASPSFGHPRTQIPSDMGIPFQSGCRVFGILRYPPLCPKH